MRLYKPLAKHDGRVPRSTSRHTNPFYGSHGADWLKDGDGSLYNAQHEHSNRKLHVEHQVSHVTFNVMWSIVAIIVMLVGGFIVFSLAINF